MGLPASSLHKISILQYADGTILFDTYDIKEAAMLKFILCCFEVWLGLYVNFHKNSIVHLGRTEIIGHMI